MTVILDPGNQAESYNTTVRQWRQSSGLWKADYGTSQANLSTCSTNLTNMTNDRNYWKTTVAHDDPNVWTNQYNAGVAAGDAAAQATWRPPGLTQGTPAGAVNGVPDNQWANLAGAAYTATRTGYYALYAECMVSGLSGSYNSGQQGQMRILRDGSIVLVTGTSAGLKPDNNTSDTMIACFVLYGPVPLGAVFQAQVGTSDLPAAGGTRNYYSGKLYWVFVPESSYPK